MTQIPNRKATYGLPPYQSWNSRYTKSDAPLFSDNGTFDFDSRMDPLHNPGYSTFNNLKPRSMSTQANSPVSAVSSTQTSDVIPKKNTLFGGLRVDQTQRFVAQGGMKGVKDPSDVAAQVIEQTGDLLNSNTMSKNNYDVNRGYSDTMSGLNGLWLGMEGTASRTAMAERLGHEQTDNRVKWINNIFGPAGHLLSSQLRKTGLGMGDSAQVQKALDNTDFKTVTTNEGDKVDPRTLINSTYKGDSTRDTIRFNRPINSVDQNAVIENARQPQMANNIAPSVPNITPSEEVKSFTADTATPIDNPKTPNTTKYN